MMDTFLSVERARQQVLAGVSAIGTERVFLSDARSRYLAETIRAPEDSPRFDNSSRDGFAVRWEDLQDLPTVLKCVETSLAGDAENAVVGPGEAARIATGAPVPDGADTVVMQENCTVEGDSVRFDERPEDGRGAWIRHAGSHMNRGEVLLRPGDRLQPAALGMLASFGDSRLEVYRRPTVAVVSTGDELVDIDTAPGEGEIVNSNAHLLDALIAEFGGIPTILPAAEDTAESVRSCFQRALRSADLVLSSGGVSVGDRDEVRGVVDELTGGMEFWKIRMKPGKPLAHGTASEHGNVPIIGLPGNPNSCFVGFHQFVRPLIQILQGGDPDQYASPHRMRARADDSVESTPHRRHYLAGRLRYNDDGSTPTFLPARAQSSGNLGLFAGQNAFGLVPEGCSRLEAGAELEVEPLSLLW